MAFIKRTWLNKIYIAKLATRWTSGIFAVLGLVGTFVSLSDLLGENMIIGRRILISIIILIAVWIVMLIACSVYVYKKKRIEVLEVSNGYHVYVQYGDVFEPSEVLNPSQRRNVIIPVNRCFDTIVDNDLISEETLHGVAMKRLYSEGIFDENTLNTALQNNLAVKQLDATVLSTAEKRSGNLKRFPVGTVAEIKISDSLTYFFLGLSAFDSNLHAHTSDDDYVLALMRLLKFCNDRSQKYPIVMPLIGAGASDTRKGERYILEFLVKLIKMNRELINCDVHIVVRDNGKESIAITDL